MSGHSGYETHSRSKMDDGKLRDSRRAVSAVEQPHASDILGVSGARPAERVTRASPPRVACGRQRATRRQRRQMVRCVLGTTRGSSGTTTPRALRAPRSNTAQTGLRLRSRLQTHEVDDDRRVAHMYEGSRLWTRWSVSATSHFFTAQANAQRL